MDLSKAFDDLTWDNVVIEDGVLKSIREFPINELKHKDLRAVCSRLKLKGVKNTTKESMIEKIVSVYKLKDRYSRLNEDVDPFLTPTRKEPQCPYRLLNVQFSDVGLSQLGNAAAQFELDSGKASNNQLFWEGVQEAFTSPYELIDNLHFDNEVFNDLHHINFKRIIHQCLETTRQTSSISAKVVVISITFASISKASQTLMQLWLQICQSK